MSEIVVTQAMPADAPRIARLIVEWVQTSAIAWPEPEPEPLIAWVVHTLEVGYGVLAQHSGRLVGIAAIQPCWMPWNRQVPMMRDAWFYVPRSRSRSEMSRERVEAAARRAPGVADALMTALKLYCAKREMPLMMEVISGVDTESVDKWYGVRGGKYCGGVYVFGLDGKAAAEG